MVSIDISGHMANILLKFVCKIVKIINKPNTVKFDFLISNAC